MDSKAILDLKDILKSSPYRDPNEIINPKLGLVVNEWRWGIGVLLHEIIFGPLNFSWTKSDIKNDEDRIVVLSKEVEREEQKDYGTMEERKEGAGDAEILKEVKSLLFINKDRRADFSLDFDILSKNFS